MNVVVKSIHSFIFSKHSRVMVDFEPIPRILGIIKAGIHPGWNAGQVTMRTHLYT